MDSDKTHGSETIHVVQNHSPSIADDTEQLAVNPQIENAIRSQSLDEQSTPSKCLRGDFMDEQVVEATILIPFEKVGLVIGRSGRNIKSIQEKTRTRMHVVQERNQSSEDEDPAQRKRTLTITGTKEDVADAEKLVHLLLSRARDTTTSGHREAVSLECEKSPASPLECKDRKSDEERQSNGRQKRGYKSSMQIPVPSMAMGLIIGRGGETIKKIRNTSGAKIQFHPSYASRINDEVDEHMAIVTGSGHQIRYACDLIEGLITTALVSYNKGRPRGGRGRNRVFQGTSRWGPCIQAEEESMDSPRPPGSSGQQTVVNSGEDACSNEESNTEEDKITLTLEEYEVLVKEYQNPASFIQDVTGAHCELEESKSNENGECHGKTLLLIGYRHQIRYAQDLLAQILSNDQSVKVSESGEVENSIDGPIHYSPPKGSYEWGQGEPAGYHWSSGYYDPGLVNTVRTGQNSHPLLGYPYPGYSHAPYIHPVHPEVQHMPAPLQDPNKAEPTEVGSEQPVRHEPIAPVPIMSATIVQTPDQSGQFLGPPTIYFSLPQVPVVNLTHKEREPEPDLVDLSQNLCNEKNNDVQASPEVEQSECTNLEVEKAALEKDDVESCNNQSEKESSIAPSPDDCNPGPIPDVTNNYSNPQMLGIPGSHTRIVTFYYDLNVNSVVIMNQWQQY